MAQWFGRYDSRFISWGICVVLLLALLPVAADAHGQDDGTDEFIQFGTAGNDVATSIAILAEESFVAGSAGGALPGQEYSESGDAFVRRYDADWNELWTRQFGTAFIDTASGIAVDDSGVYVVGFTAGTLDGQTQAGQGDAFIRKYDHDGSQLWTWQFGTSASDEAMGVAVGPAGVYVSGSTSGTFPDNLNAGGLSDAFVRAYDRDGNGLWTRQFGTSGSDAATAVAADDNTIYAAGYLGSGSGSATSQQAFVRTYSATGDSVWTQEFGTETLDAATAVAATAAGVFVAGYTFGTFPDQVSAGSFDAFVQGYDRDGNERWTRQFGTSSWDQAGGISASEAGVVVAGWTEGVLPEQTGQGLRDAFARRYDGAGNEQRTWQFGTEIIDSATDVITSGSAIAVTGSSGSLVIGEGGSPNYDAFIALLIDTGITAPAVVATNPGTDATDVATDSGVSVTFSEDIVPASLTADTFTLHDASGNLVPGDIGYDSSTLTATLVPTQPLSEATTYKATISGGPEGVRNTAGGSLEADYSWAFTTVDDEACPCRLWDDSVTPAIPNATFPLPVEIGLKFTSDMTGQISGIHFYKGSENPGQRTVSLWHSNGQLLAQMTATIGSGSGWQYVAFSRPVTIYRGVVYVASYHTAAGDYGVDRHYFSDTGFDNGPLHALSSDTAGGNGVYRFGWYSVFPTRTWYDSNYWVDVSFTPIARMLSS